MASIDSNSVADTSSIRKNTGAVASLTCYEITEDELDVLARGLPSSNLKDFGIAALSSGLSFLGGMLGLSCEPAACARFSVLLALSLSGIAIGVVLLLVWKWTKSGGEPLLIRIRSRLIQAVAVTPVDRQNTEGTASAVPGSTM